jgi:hypothetical protein
MNPVASTKQRSLFGTDFAEEHAANAAVDQRHAGEKVRFAGKVQIQSTAKIGVRRNATRCEKDEMLATSLHTYIH